jgi:GH15 family glucan-1,4-alpha-glucosidase
LVWRERATQIRRYVFERCWNEARKSFVSTVDGDALDAAMLLLADLGFVAADDPRFVSTVAAIERELKRGDFIFRYVESDDFGVPENAFVVCTFWYTNALAAIGRRDEARAVFERMLGCRNRHGLLAEHLDHGNRRVLGKLRADLQHGRIGDIGIRLSMPWSDAF